MKKKLVAFMLVISMLAVAVVGGTLAYFTDEEEATNVMTFGNVDIEQIEQERDEQGNIVDFTQNKPLLPMGGAPAWADEEVTVNGDNFKVFASENVIDKFVTVNNNGNTDAYVRTIVALEAGKSEEEANDLWYNNIAITDNTLQNEDSVVCENNDLYVEIDGTYYIILVYTYTNALEAGAQSEASLTGVALYKETTQDDIANLGDTYEILVKSQAVQAADMGDDAGAALDAAFGEVNAANVAAWFAE